MRRKGRQCALQFIYQLDLQGRFDDGSELGSELDGVLGEFWTNFDSVDDSERAFTERLVKGTVDCVEQLDAAIAGASHRWKLSRMAQVDRSLLRLAAYEILYCADIPKAASINEAIELAKRFSGGESTSFINGILDNLEPVAAEADGV